MCGITYKQHPCLLLSAVVRYNQPSSFCPIQFCLSGVSYSFDPLCVCPMSMFICSNITVDVFNVNKFCSYSYVLYQIYYKFSLHRLTFPSGNIDVGLWTSPLVSGARSGQICGHCFTSRELFARFAPFTSDEMFTRTSAGSIAINTNSTAGIR